jgi:hypothetical protein
VVEKLDLWCPHRQLIRNVKNMCYLNLIPKCSKRANNASIFFMNMSDKKLFVAAGVVLRILGVSSVGASSRRYAEE